MEYLSPNEEAVEISLTPEAQSVLRARRSLRALEDYLGPRTFGDLELVVSELVTNAVRHAGLSTHQEIQLFIEVAEGEVSGVVGDWGTGFMPAELTEGFTGAPDPDGWGLTLVEGLCDCWGTSHAEGAFYVWFEMVY